MLVAHVRFLMDTMQMHWKKCWMFFLENTCTCSPKRGVHTLQPHILRWLGTSKHLHLLSYVHVLKSNACKLEIDLFCKGLQERDIVLLTFLMVGRSLAVQYLFLRRLLAANFCAQNSTGFPIEMYCASICMGTMHTEWCKILRNITMIQWQNKSKMKKWGASKLTSKGTTIFHGVLYPPMYKSHKTHS